MSGQSKSNQSKGSGTNIDISLDQDFDIDYKNERKVEDKTTETTNTTTNNTNVNKSYEVELTYTQGHKKAFELETEHTTTNNYNKNVDVDISKSEYDEKIKLDVEKKVHETITVQHTDISDWDVDVNVYSENIIQSSEVHSDEDVNDIDTSELINVRDGASLTLDDFNLDITAIGGSFNGAGNDGLVTVSQSNNLVDNDEVSDTKTEYVNNQAPNVAGYLDAGFEASAEHHAGSSGYAAYKDEYTEKTAYDKWGKPEHSSRDGVVNGHAGTHSWYGAEAMVAGTLAIDLSLTAPETAFETVTAQGGTSTAGDGIGAAHLNTTNNDNEGDGIVSGAASASADASAAADAFSNDIMAGGNQQANFATINLVGGDQLDADNIKGVRQADDAQHGADAGDGGLAIKDSHVTLDDDVNDLDTSKLINVSGELDMDDFSLDVLSIGNSFNGAGNDWAFDVNQANDLVDKDTVTGTYTGYYGEGWNAPFQSVSATGGMADAGNGIGYVNGHNVANGNGGDGGILGSTAASANADASAVAFTNSIVVGANLQVNSFSANIIGGDNAIVDDITA
jgi:hypothetical protein